MSSTKGFTVLVVDQHSVARAGVKSMLGERCKVFEAGSGREAVRLARQHKPDIAVMDIPLPEINGLLAAHQIIQSGCGTRILLLTDQTEDRDIERAVNIRVHGYLCKSSPIAKLPLAVRAIRQGMTWFDAVIQAHIDAHAHLPGYAQQRDTPLSDRELEVLSMIALSYTTRQIAGELGISPKTVERHRDNLGNKLNRHDVASLTRYAIKAGIVLKK